MASTASQPADQAVSAQRRDKYRGATVEDLDPPAALSCNPNTLVSSALVSALERDYTHLTVISPEKRSLVGYLSIPKLQSLLDQAIIQPTDQVEKAMTRFRRQGGKPYQTITKDTLLADLDAFFAELDERGEGAGFAIVTDPTRRFVVGVATKADLEEFVKRRPH